jgi:HD-GYP domain-containing protein (c-di-GMP phosphodiesterase class II)
VVDHTGKLLDTNDQYCKLSGFKRDELVGTHITTWLAEGINTEEAASDKPAQHLTLKHKDGTPYEATLLLDEKAINEHTRVILIQKKDEPLANAPAAEGSLKLNTVLEIMRYAGDADEGTLLQFAVSQLAATFKSPLAMFASVDAATQQFRVMSYTYVHGGKRTAIVTSEPIPLPAEFRDALSQRNALVRNDASETRIDSQPTMALSRYLLCPAAQGNEQWFLLVANHDSGYSPADQHQLQSCADILVTLLTLKRRQTQTQGLQHQAQSEASSLLGVLQRLLAQHDPFANNGGTRVAALASAIGKEMGLGAEQCSRLSTAAQLHDIGHLLIPQSLLLRPTALEPGEQALMRTHVDRGVQLLEGLELGDEVLTPIAQHHERLDGSGYPKRLRGDEIKLESRILAAADVVEAMCSARAYRPAKGVDAALEELKSGSGKLYDADVVKACVEVFKDAKQEWPK